MLCPACRSLIHERAPACLHCGFDLAAAERFFGLPPQLNNGVTDLAGALRPRERRNVAQALYKARIHFPQLRFSTVISRLPLHVPIRAYAFWLFNQPALNTPMEKGGACRLVLFAMDVEHQRLACMVGYGLELFVGEDTLERILSAAQRTLSAQDYAGAILAALEQAETELASLSRGIPEAFGLHVAQSEETPAEEVFAY